MGEYRVISSDSHIIEPVDLWTSRIEPRFRERVPHVVRDEDGYDYWYTDGEKMYGVQPGTQAGRRFEEPEKLTRKDVLENVRPGGYIPEEHVKDMDVDSVDVGIIYPTIGLFHFKVVDSELLTAILTIYNDWIAEFCKPFPNRLKGIGIINTDDVQQGVKELERCAKMGLVGSMISSYYDGKAYDSPEYEILWDAAEDLGVPLSLHAGTNRFDTFASKNNTPLTNLVNQDHWVRMSLAEMALSGVFERHPKLQVGAIEHELAWIPHFLSRLDFAYTQFPQPDNAVRFKDDMIPSDYIRRNVFFSFQEDARGITERHAIGVDTLLWGSDYPHQEGTFPRSRQILEDILAECSEEEKAKIAGTNAARVYQLN